MIRLIVVGRLKAEWARTACDDYAKRLRRFARPEIVEVNDSDPQREASDILRAAGQSTLVACDLTGDNWTSERWSKLVGAEGSISFAIGGPEGLDERVRAEARHVVAFGQATLPHELARVVLLEQIYRGFTILRGHPYHR